jgi:hypothetical protein
VGTTPYFLIARNCQEAGAALFVVGCFSGMIGGFTLLRLYRSKRRSSARKSDNRRNAKGGYMADDPNKKKADSKRQSKQKHEVSYQRSKRRKATTGRMRKN